MRHLKKGKKFGRERDHRKALMKSLASSFFMLGRITTTEAKAKALRPFVEKLITKAKKQNLVSRRSVMAVLPEKAGHSLFGVAKTFSGRNGGYTRVIKTGIRRSDSAKMAILELVQ